MGFIAQELEQVLPNSVLTDKSPDAIKQIDYISMIPVLNKAIQEQQATINAQHERLEKLESLVKELLEKSE